MNPLLVIGPILFVIGGMLTGIGWLIRSDTPVADPIVVGSTFVHANPGRSNNPNENVRPFAMIYTVGEIKDGKAHVLRRVVRIDGEINEWAEWLLLDDVGQYDQRVK